MNSRGFSLVELVVVIAIAAALTAIATLNFNEYSRKAAMEGQMRMICSDMLELRQKALYEKVPRAVKITATHFFMYPGASTTAPPIVDRELKYPVVLSGGGTEQVLVFDSFGVSDVESFAACIDPNNNPAYVDSVVASHTTIRTGKQGASCVESAITLR